MTEAVSIITDRVRERVRKDGADLTGVGVAERYVRDEVQRYSERALGGSLPPFFHDPTVEEIWSNAPVRVFVARNGIPELTSLELIDREVYAREKFLSHGSAVTDIDGVSSRRGARVSSRGFSTRRTANFLRFP